MLRFASRVSCIRRRDPYPDALQRAALHQTDPVVMTRSWVSATVKWKMRRESPQRLLSRFLETSQAPARRYRLRAASKATPPSKRLAAPGSGIPVSPNCRLFEFTMKFPA